MINYNVIPNTLCELGEGSYWDSVNKTLYWVDIPNKKLFSLKHKNMLNWKLPAQASVILDVDGDSVFMASENGIVCFSMKREVWDVISPIPSMYAAKTYRSNDGIKVNDDTFLYGVMDKYNQNGQGSIIVSKDKVSKVVYEGISIPNTFIRIPGTYDVLISDSYEQIVYKFCFSEDWTKVNDKVVWLDLSDTDDVPDGGCISSKGIIFIAIWDGFKVIKISENAEILCEYLLPVPRPTSCTLSLNEKYLYITSAFEGLSKSLIQNHPLSGSVIKVELNA